MTIHQEPAFLVFLLTTPYGKLQAIPERGVSPDSDVLVLSGQLEFPRLQEPGEHSPPKRVRVSGAVRVPADPGALLDFQDPDLVFTPWWGVLPGEEERYAEICRVILEEAIPPFLEAHPRIFWEARRVRLKQAAREWQTTIAKIGEQLAHAQEQLRAVRKQMTELEQSERRPEDLGIEGAV